MIYVLNTATLLIFIYYFSIIVRNDAKRVLLHKFVSNHIKMERLYGELEKYIFLKDYSEYPTLDKGMSYDLYLTGIKYQNEIFERELQELRTSKFTNEVQKRFHMLLHHHEKLVMVLQCEIHRVVNTRLLHPAVDGQQSA